MWSPRSCPRCRGDIFVVYEVGARVETCLQCGFVREIDIPVIHNSCLEKRRELVVTAPDNKID
jgi:hypothetical protein